MIDSTTQRSHQQPRQHHHSAATDQRSRSLIVASALLVLVQCLAATKASTLLSPFPRRWGSSSSSSSKSMRKNTVRVAMQRFENAYRRARLEQVVEDANAAYIASSNSTAVATRNRCLICLPLDERFDPPMGAFSHKHVQTGDKMSLPYNFQQSIVANHAEVPWLFLVKRVPIPRPDNKNVDNKADSDESNKSDAASTSTVGDINNLNVRVEFKETDDITHHIPLKKDLEQCVGSILDFRAPSCYVFLPHWMMRALGLRPWDLVQVSLVTTIPPGSLVVFRPHSSDFAKDITNPQAVMETELRHYSSLTAGTTIAMDYNNKRYWLDVVELRAEGNSIEPMVKVQDCNLATNFLPSREVLKERKEKKRQRELDRQKEQQP